MRGGVEEGASTNGSSAPAVLTVSSIKFVNENPLLSSSSPRSPYFSCRRIVHCAASMLRWLLSPLGSSSQELSGSVKCAEFLKHLGRGSAREMHFRMRADKLAAMR